MRELIKIWLMRALVTGFVFLLPIQGFALDDSEDEVIFTDIRLMGADLIDEMVYSWKSSPPLNMKKGVVLTEITAPVGLDDRFSVFVENRLYEILQLNKDLPIELVHCTVCQQYIVKSTPKGTMISRGIDQPEVLKNLLEAFPDKIGLSLRFEAEGRELVLRATFFELDAKQKIVWARSYSTSMSARRVLRDGAPLVSLETARNQQRQILAGKDPLEITTRFTVSMFSGKAGNTVAPLPFFEQSFEAVPLPRRNLRAAFTAGFISLKDSLEAWSVGGHVAKLMGAKSPSLVNPDYYWFLGLNYIRMRGPGAEVFNAGEIDVARMLDRGIEPKASITNWRLGVETHIKYKFGMLAYLQYSPQLKKSEIINTTSVLGIPYQAVGWGIVIRW